LTESLIIFLLRI